MAKPYITALLDTYNQGRFIEEAISSVVAQDFPQNALEIIVVDDGSTDDTAQRVARFGHRVRYLPKANGGQASALNAGFAAARGEIIALLDGDDTWMPRKLTAVVEALERQPNAVLAYHPMQFYDAAARRISLNSGFTAISGTVLDRMDSALRYGSVSTSNMALRRTAVARLTPIPEGMRIYADSYLAYLAIFLGPVAAVDEPLTRYRIHGSNLATSADKSAEALRRRCMSFRAALDAIREWLATSDFDVARPEAAAFLKRQELVAQMLDFTATAPGRVQYCKYLTEFNRLYAPLWTRGYRAFRSAMPPLALLAGYSGFEALQRMYARGAALRVRERWISTGSTESGAASVRFPQIVGSSK